MERCKTCAWWKAYGTQREWGDCLLTVRTEYGRRYEGTLAVVGSPASADGEPASNVLETHMTFGCVQHEPRKGE